MFKVFKFGGASLKDAKAVVNMGSIIDRFVHEKLVVVVSAMGKTTNALEAIFNKAWGRQEYSEEFRSLEKYHIQIANEIFGSPMRSEKVIRPWLEALSGELMNLSGAASYDEGYDRIIPYGELISSSLVYDYLVQTGRKFVFLDARELVITDERFRDAGVNWNMSCLKINRIIRVPSAGDFFITQGFIGKSESGKMTTLGREGSDYTASIFAHCLSADSVTIWKDVPGILNADPKRMPETELYEKLSYQEAAEMSYYGATVIHPKTIKPLADKNIPLYVKSFADPTRPGTLVAAGTVHPLPPTFIFKDLQCLISFTRKDLEFINEKNLGEIFSSLDRLNLRINLMQNSAVSFTICVNEDPGKINELIALLSGNFKILYNEGLQLITIKNYTREAIESISRNKNILVEQRTRNTFQIVIREDQA